MVPMLTSSLHFLCLFIVDKAIVLMLPHFFTFLNYYISRMDTKQTQPQTQGRYNNGFETTEKIKPAPYSEPAVSLPSFVFL